jgi:hypothetical protein
VPIEPRIPTAHAASASRRTQPQISTRTVRIAVASAESLAIIIGLTASVRVPHPSKSTLWGARPAATRSGTIGVVSEGSAVFVLANDDPLPMAFESLASAAGYMEAVDVENGLYSTPDPSTGLSGAVYTVDGRVVEASATNDAVELNITTHHDPAGLQSILQRAAEHGLINGDPADPSNVARELLDKQWNSRWPQRPRWLDRRFHGADPPSI